MKRRYDHNARRPVSLAQPPPSHARLLTKPGYAASYVPEYARSNYAPSYTPAFSAINAPIYQKRASYAQSQFNNPKYEEKSLERVKNNLKNPNYEKHDLEISKVASRSETPESRSSLPVFQE